ncbi:NAD(P)/FAD-dependent oxidoreductase [Spiroplasma endosymbiont of Nephrotoma flavescens]|uniref:NAD(P)/FAD-dependent oxidoreductase n=1 Tax=Spiroplasma endosymbiont of Nephrotoma flavescens TaxID=3066302 RepID=UPI00313C0A65
MKKILIIGSGIVGLELAKELLAQSNNKITIIEKNQDVCSETSILNSNIIHMGFDATPGTLKAILGMQGHNIWKKRYLADKKANNEIIKYAPSQVLGFNEDDVKILDRLLKQGIVNGINSNLLTLNANSSSNKNVSKYLLGVDSYILNVKKYVTLLLEQWENNDRIKIIKNCSFVALTTKLFFDGHKDVISSDFDLIINCAGHGAQFNIEETKNFSLSLRKGQYLVCENEDNIDVIYFLPPTSLGKGILVAPSFENKIIIGPTAENHNDYHNHNTIVLKTETIQELIATGKKIKPDLNFNITSMFAGSRSIEAKNDFHIEWGSEKWINVVGISSPGLSASPAIAKYVVNMIQEKELKNKN